MAERGVGGLLAEGVEPAADVGEGGHDAGCVDLKAADGVGPADQEVDVLIFGQGDVGDGEVFFGDDEKPVAVGGEAGVEDSSARDDLVAERTAGGDVPEARGVLGEDEDAVAVRRELRGAGGRGDQRLSLRLAGFAVPQADAGVLGDGDDEAAVRREDGAAQEPLSERETEVLRLERLGDLPVAHG